MARTAPQIKVADEVWLATALLHRENPFAEDFSLKEIEDRAAQEDLSDERRRGVYQHIVQHCVANRPPNPNDYRMLYETRPKHRRLFRLGTATIPSAVERSSRRRTTSLSVMTICCSGTKSGVAPRWREQSCLIRCSPSMGRANTCGPTNTPTNTWRVCARAGNEPGLLGYQYLHLLL